MAGSWEEQKSQKRPLGLILTAIAALILIVFFVLNNIDIIIPAAKKSTREPVQQSEQKAGVQTSVVDSMRQDTSSKTAAPVHPEPQKAEVKKIDVKPAEEKLKVDTVLKESRIEQFTVEIPGVLCKLDQGEKVSVQISLKLFVKGKQFQQEVLFKRDDIKLMIKRVLANKRLSDIVVDALRVEILQQINALLEKNSVVDIEFLEFRPIAE